MEQKCSLLLGSNVRREWGTSLCAQDCPSGPLLHVYTYCLPIVPHGHQPWSHQPLEDTVFPYTSPLFYPFTFSNLFTLAYQIFKVCLDFHAPLLHFTEILEFSQYWEVLFCFVFLFFLKKILNLFLFSSRDTFFSTQSLFSVRLSNLTFPSPHFAYLLSYLIHLPSPYLP